MQNVMATLGHVVAMAMINRKHTWSRETQTQLIYTEEIQRAHFDWKSKTLAVFRVTCTNKQRLSEGAIHIYSMLFITVTRPFLAYSLEYLLFGYFGVSF